MIVVGRVFCDGDTCWVSQGRDSDDGMMAKLRYLVDASSPRPYQKLLKIMSEFWSFVEVNEPHGGRP